MFRFILTAMFTVTISVNAQNRNESETKTFNEFLSAVQSGTESNTIPTLYDFNNKIRQGLDFMSPESSINNLRCEKLTNWSDASSKKLHSYLEEKYDNNMSQRDPGWIDSVISYFKNNQSYFGIMHWELMINGELNSIQSIAVFDSDWKVLFDTELINFVFNAGEVEDSEDETSPLIEPETDVIISQRTGVANANYNLNGPFGSVRLRNHVSASAFVPPYITGATNDADFNFNTTQIISDRINETGIPPVADPFLYFGIDGQYATLYQNATPYHSSIYLTNDSDSFNDGEYTVTGANGNNWSFDFDFSVSIGPVGIGITPHSSVSPLSLSPVNLKKIYLENYTYMYNAVTYDIRALFYNGGSLTLDNFYIKTRSGGNELGTANASLNLRVGHHYDGVLSEQTYFHPNSSILLNILNLQYVRGDAVLQPEYQLTSTNYNFSLGQIDTLKVKVTNNSHIVGLSGGTVSINPASLDNKLTLLSAGSLSIGTIDTSASKIFRFTVRGNANGIVTPQANISTLGWSWPVPPEVVINEIAGIDNNIEVGQVGGTLGLTNFIQGFYNSNTNNMTRDTVTVNLRNSVSPYIVVDAAKAYMSNTGTAQFNFFNVNSGIPYYIQLKHRNSTETWSASPQSFVNSVMTYDFSDLASKAYGNNMIQIDASPLRFGIYSGDVNQDGSIDAIDQGIVDNDAFNFISGYVNSDVNGDNFMDALDLGITDNNAFNFVSKISPP